MAHPLGNLSPNVQFFGPSPELPTSEEEVKEEFDLKIPDDELLATIKNWERESDEFFAPLLPIWDINENYYRGNQTGVDTIVGRNSKAVENRIYMATETMIPIATSRLPEIEVRAGSEDEADQQDADDLKDIIGFQFERLNIQEQAEWFLRYMLIFRYGVWGPTWNKELDDVDFDVIHPRRIRFGPFGKTVDELPYIIKELEMSFEQVKDMFGKEKANELLKDSREESENKQRRSTFTIKEVWTDHMVAWKTNNLILDKKANPFYTFGNKKKNFFRHPRKPFIIKSLFQTDESIVGGTDYIQATISIQDNINVRKRQIEDVIGKVANPSLLIDSNVMSEEQAGNITNEPGQILYGKDAADPNKIRFENPGQVPNYIFLDLEASRTQFDNIWGIHSTTRGEREGKETLGGRQLLKQADLGRIDLVSRNLERALDELGGWFTQFIKMFYTEDRAFSIIGEDGTRMIQNFSGKKIGENVMPQIVAGSTLPKDEVTQRQEALQLFQLGALGPRTLYKKLKMANRQDAIQDLQEFLSGQFAQGGQQQEQGSTAGLPGLPPV